LQVFVAILVVLIDANFEKHFADLRKASGLLFCKFLDLCGRIDVQFGPNAVVGRVANLMKAAKSAL